MSGTAEIKKAKNELVKIGKRISKMGFVVGPGGNTSVRVGNIILMKASGVSFEEAVPDDYVGVDLKTGKQVSGKKKPTCEIGMHLSCYRNREDVNAVIHCHPPLSVAWGMQGEPLRPFNPETVAIICSIVPVLPYMVSVSDKFVIEITKLIKKHNAAFLANHGLVAVGSNLKEALYRTILIEDSIKTIIAAKTLGKMRYFSADETKIIDESDFEQFRRKLLRKKQ